MRKALLSVICAVVLVVSFAATASAAVEVQGPDTVTSGSEIQIRITGTTMGLAANITTTGLEFVSANGGLSDEKNVILLKDIGGMEGVYTYKVTASEGQQVSFALTRVTESDGTQDIPEDNVTWAGTVGGAFSTVTTQPMETITPASQTQNAQPADTATQVAGGDTTQTPTETPTVEQTAEPTPTDAPGTSDGSVNIWLLSIAAVACAVIAVLVGKRIYRSVR